MIYLVKLSLKKPTLEEITFFDNNHISSVWYSVYMGQSLIKDRPVTKDCLFFIPCKVFTTRLDYIDEYMSRA